MHAYWFVFKWPVHPNTYAIKYSNCLFKYLLFRGTTISQKSYCWGWSSVLPWWRNQNISQQCDTLTIFLRAFHYLFTKSHFWHVFSWKDSNMLYFKVKHTVHNSLRCVELILKNCWANSVILLFLSWYAWGDCLFSFFKYWPPSQVQSHLVEYRRSQMCYIPTPTSNE